MATSAITKPFEVVVDLMLPMLYLVHATKRCLGDDSLKWKLSMLAFQIALATMLVDAFSSLESAIRSRLDAQSVAKVQLVRQSFPKHFLRCTLDDDPLETGDGDNGSAPPPLVGATGSTPTALSRELFLCQLEREMLKRRPDHFILGVVCRSLGGVPDRVRSSVWKEILGVTRAERLFLEQSIMQVEEDLENQKVISADACRTRGHDPFFRQPETVELIAKLLTYYCKCRGVRYKQGMNEVLAPFLILERDPPLPEGVVFQCFYALIDRFLPHVFVDREFKSLQCSFQLYRLLLLYHDPALCHYLDQHDMTPELYVTPWFMTLFARSLPADLVFRLWDFFLLEEHPFLLHFVAYALVAANKDRILRAEIALLPQVLTSLTFGSRSELEAICEAALQLANTTPRSFERDLYSVCYGGYSDDMLPFLRQLSGASSLQVYPDELVANLLQRLAAKSPSSSSLASPARAREASRNGDSSDADDGVSMNPLDSPLARSSSFSKERLASASSVFFIVLDCRPIEQYRECHLSLSYHIDPEVVGSPDALAVLLKGFSRMKGCHFCFVGLSEPSESAAKPGNIAFDTISRLARGISGDKKPPPVDVQSSPVLSPPSAVAGGAATSSTGASGSGQAATGAHHRKLHYEHISVTRLVLMFLQKGFEHISRLDGGFDELKREILAMDAFAQEQLLVHAASPTPSSASPALAGFKLLSKIGLTRLRNANSEDNITISSADAPAGRDANADAGARAKPKLSTFSQRIQLLTSAAKDAVSQGASTVRAARSRSASENAPPIALGVDSASAFRQLVGEDEWVEVCLRTKEALEKSLAYKEVVFQAGSMGILLQKARTSTKFQAVVDSIVPESQASESQQMERGDLLVSVNGQSMENVPFLSVVELVKDARRPVVLRFENPNAKKALESFDAISLPPTAPALVSATHHSVGITWSKLSLPNIRYHLQYAQQSEFHFNPWATVAMKQDGSSELSTSGITAHTNGLLVGLDPGQSFVFRVRCGNGDKWGPYSMSSNPISTLEKSAEEEDATTEANDSTMHPTDAPGAAKTLMNGNAPSHPVFLPGACPVFVEHGLFYYRVIIGLRARNRPAFDADKLDVVIEKGTVIRCTDRMVAPGTNQIFVRVASDDACLDGRDAALDDDQMLADVGDDDVGVWAFENTPEGTVVLERLSGEPAELEAPVAVAVPLQEQAKAVVASIFSSGGAAKSPASGSSSADMAESAADRPSSARVVVVHVAPRILQVFAVSPTAVVVTWDPINDIGVTKYHIQCSKNRLTAMWWTVSQEIEASTLKHTVHDLAPNTAYLFRIRAFSDGSGWGPYSDASESCKTPPAEEAKGAAPKSDSAHSSEAGNKEEQPSSAPESRTASGNGFRLPVGSMFTAPSSSTAPTLRTGSTFLDKAVAAASRLTLSTRRRSLSSTSASSSSVSALGGGQESDEQEANDDEQDQMIEDDGGITHVNLGHWKRDADGTFQDFRFFTVAQYERRVAAASSGTSGDRDGDSTPSEVASGLNLEKVGERELVVTRTSLFVLNAWMSKREGYAVLEHSRMLESLVKITAQKSVKNLIVLHFKNESFSEPTDSVQTAQDGDACTVADADSSAVAGSEPTASQPNVDRLYFVVSDPDACVSLVRRYYEQLMS
ncbi:hypothetical protein PybrP1_000412 [[Pythium] brassicae (nom. inval.)]|nr:hypothetical protein PybrP1_000412 [[Pythium] brassicae (nom. inval.)]